jgi:hypothetical protein
MLRQAWLLCRAESEKQSVAVATEYINYQLISRIRLRTDQEYAIS